MDRMDLQIIVQTYGDIIDNYTLTIKHKWPPIILLSTRFNHYCAERILPETVTILCRVVRMIPECTRLPGHCKVVPNGILSEYTGHERDLPYRKESSGIMGHWVTKAGPSISLVPAWKRPCQC